MLSRMQRCSSEVSCVTMPMAPRRLSCVTWVMSCPSMVMRPALRLVKAQQQVHQGGFAGAGAANQANALARANVQVQPIDDFLPPSL